MKDLAKKKKQELLDIAQGEGLAVDETMTKAQIITAIDLATANNLTPDVGEIIEGANGVNNPTPEPDATPVDEHGYPLNRYEQTSEAPQPDPESVKNTANYRDSQNNDVKVLTDTELFRIIAKDKGSNPYRKFKFIKMFEDLNPGFKWPQTSQISRLTYLQNLAHYQQYKDTPK